MRPRSLDMLPDAALKRVLAECNGKCWAKWVDPACPKHGTKQGNK
jgi:hypothetical protein